MDKKQSIKHLTIAALFAALIAVFTAFIFHIPIKIGANTAYLHFGDAFIFIAASLLPTPYAVAAAVWMPFTFVAKALIALTFTKKGKTINKRNIFAIFLSLIITVVIYYVAEALIYGNWITPALSVLGNVVQIVGSGIIYLVLGLALDKTKIKNMI
ncbi:MAG: TIGR04002 family protein [Acutalibacteraceae bacterium]|nr:TIGR04002 family protein [Acutalibacteraceae bacterium]